ncbi:MAG: hypothetical protein KDC10_08275 [Calditrichaeota bacterium]|nr:hypothetical protein [Candidatus Cloacimonadota bacterium]MCB1047189.1 hypothetical protein [Calditrichota bacterium]
MLLLDAGNIYSLKRGDEPEREVKFILENMDDQKYDVGILGAKDLDIPDSSLQKMIRFSDFQWVGTDIVDARRPKDVKPWLIKKVDGVKVGVFSFLDKEYRFNNVDSTEVVDNLEATAKKLRSKVDVLVLVAHTDNRTVEKLVERVPMVDVIVLGGNANPMFTEKTVGQTVIGCPGDRGRHIGVFELELNRQKNITRTSYGMVVLDHNFPSDPVVAQKMEDFKREAEEAKRAQIEKRRIEKLHTLGIDPASLPGQDDPNHYVGESECRTCHTEIYSAWKSTPHARAFSELIRARESDNEEKLPRYVTGYLEKSGYLNRLDTPLLMNVQCESCHGRGSEHVRTEGKALETLNPNPGNSCVQCHSAESQPDFDLTEGLKHVHNIEDMKIPQNAVPVRPQSEPKVRPRPQAGGH